MFRQQRNDSLLEVQKALITLFSQVVKLPVHFYIARGEGLAEVKPEGDIFEEPHCIEIKKLPGGAERCHKDQRCRANQARDERGEDLTLCWAGMYNQAVPVRFNEKVRGVLLFGEMQLDDPAYRKDALQRHQEAMQELGCDQASAAKQRQLLLQAKKLSIQELEFYKRMVPDVIRGITALYEDESRFHRNVEQVTHEIQIRLQAVLAHAENLLLEYKTLNQAEAMAMAESVLNSAKALDTVVQDLGEYLEEYSFKPVPLRTLVEEAVSIYRIEAENKGIDFVVKLAGNTNIEMSQHHMQLAINNLVTNAIKYSFRKQPGRPRYIKVSGKPADDGYVLYIENYGVGILPEEIESGRIFNDGYQGKLTEGEYRTGTGKGLYFTKRVIDKHHGRITVTSRCMSNAANPLGEPHLTRFTVWLPYQQE